MNKSNDTTVNQNAGMEVIPKDDRLWASLCHISSFAGFVFPVGNIIAPFIIWLLKKEDSHFIDDQGKEVINFQITMTIFFFISILLIFVAIGIPILIGLIFFEIIITIIAAVRANDGEKYRYPISMRFFN